MNQIEKEIVMADYIIQTKIYGTIEIDLPDDEDIASIPSGSPDAA